MHYADWCINFISILSLLFFTEINSSHLQGLSYFGNEPVIVGILISSQENSFRVVDIGPNPENKEEAISFIFFFS